MDDLIRSLTALHTSLIDARSGYQEGLKDAHGQGLTPLELVSEGSGAGTTPQAKRRPVARCGRLCYCLDSC